ncbi:FeoB-associated Cys-rich membrane protein [Robiginitalea sediminis]|nr:FeoB-associated Cys-rich membrane protein [Robiginitalea sediminis]
MEVWQHIIAYLALGAAVFYLARKFFFPSKPSKGCGPDDCDCH